jgi:23S rRNA (uracil1939-C5)-methyltransferase
VIKEPIITKTVITGYTHDGDGVGRVNGQVVFIPGALLGEEVLAAVTGGKKGVLKGRLLEVISPHPDRSEPVCGCYASCGGCKLQHVTYAEQLKIKENLVRDALLRIGGLKDIQVHPVLGMEQPWEYRNKGHFQVGLCEGRIVLGFYAEESHQINPYPCRHLFGAGITKLSAFLEELLNRHPVKVYGWDGCGLCWIMLRESRANGEILVTFISKGEFSAEKEAIAREICHKFAGVVGVCINYKEKDSGPIMGRNTKIIVGRDWLEDRLGPFSYKISAQSFFQINNPQAEVLYDLAVRYAGLSGKETVIDAYCGIGSISLFLAQAAKKVIGIEIIPEAVADARENAKRNGITNARFILGEAEKTMPDLVKQGLQADVVVVDPPRAGCGRTLLESILAVRPKRVVYVSCNPATLARDMRILADGGYSVSEVQLVDMFPQTAHVETVTLMSRVEK